MQANRITHSNHANTVSIEGYTRKVSPTVALRELYELLEDYAPMWYTEELHQRAEAALGELTA